MDINQNYREAVKTIKEAILRSQYRAATSVNKEQLSLYYGIGRYVSKNSRIGFWGKGAIEQISSLLQKELPLKKAAALAAEIHGVKKNALYKHALEQQEQ